MVSMKLLIAKQRNAGISLNWKYTSPYKRNHSKSYIMYPIHWLFSNIHYLCMFDPTLSKEFYLFASIQVAKSSSIHSSLTFPKRSTKGSLFSSHSSIMTGLSFDQFSNIPSIVSPSTT